MSVQKNVAERVRLQCKLLRLPTLATVLDETIRRAEADNLPLADFIADLLAQEIEARRERRIERLRKQSKLPPGKTFAVFDESRLPVRIQRQLPQLQAGDFVNRAENVLCFGLPGMGNRLGRQSFWLGLGDAVERIGEGVASPISRIALPTVALLLQEDIQIDTVVELSDAT